MLLLKSQTFTYIRLGALQPRDCFCVLFGNFHQLSSIEYKFYIGKNMRLRLKQKFKLLLGSQKMI